MRQIKRMREKKLFAVVGFNENLFQQYLQICKYAYHTDLGLEDSRLCVEDKYDGRDFSRFIFICDEDEYGQCIAGARVVFHHSDTHILLPFEGRDFMLSDHLPEIEYLNTKNYTELSRVVVAPGYRDSQALRMIINQNIDLCLKYRAEYQFALTYASFTRAIVKYYRNRNLDIIIRKDIEIPKREAYGDLQLYLNYTRFSDKHYTQNIW